MALIDAAVTGASGTEPTSLATNATLMGSETTRISGKLEWLGWPFLDKPFGIDALLAEAKRLMMQRRATVQRTKLPTPATALDLEALRAEVAEAHRRFDAIVKQLRHLKL